MSISLEATNTKESNASFNAESLPVSKRDLEAEARIRDALSDGNKSYRQITYIYNHQPHEIITHFSVDKIGEVTPPLFIILVNQEMPQQLQNHLVDLVQKELKGRVRFSFTKLQENTEKAWDQATFIAGEKLEKKAFLNWRYRHDPLFYPYPWMQYAKECLSSAEFSKESFRQVYLGKNYEVVVIHNPQKQPLLAKEMKIPSYTYMVVSDKPLPPTLNEYINKNWIPDSLKKLSQDQFYVNLDGMNRLRFNLLMDYLEPVTVINLGNKSEESRIQACFKSKEFAQQAFFCKMNDQDYRVRVLHNPQQEDLSKKFDSEDRLIDWKSPTIFIFDKEAPQEVIKLFTDTLPADQKSRCQIINGSKYTYKEELDKSKIQDTYYDVWAFVNSGNMIVR